ncbi:MAG: GNAT family N-acetyltransferase [Actinomycetia bacterium]|nr:GNAT family N-acetyltransferase [Actinomycetes bacterium]
MTFTLETVRYDSHDAHLLIEELQEEYVIRYGGRDETPVDPDDFAPPRGTFLLAYRDGELVGCAGIRRRSDDDVEVKRMFIRQTYRGRGYSRDLLALVEDEARSMGFTRIMMESGLAQPEAMGLYESSGYERIPGFGHYRDEPQNRCYAKSL